MAGREIKPDCVMPGVTSDAAPSHVLYEMLVAYEQGKETAREIDEQLAVLVLQLETDALASSAPHSTRLVAAQELRSAAAVFARPLYWVRQAG